MNLLQVFQTPQKRIKDETSVIDQTTSMCNEPNQELTNKPQTNVRAKSLDKLPPSTNTNTQAENGTRFSENRAKKMCELVVENP